MSDVESTATPPPPDQSSAMESEAPQQLHHQDPQTPKPAKPMSSLTSFSIWPPTQRTRDAVINRLIETLTTPSPLSTRYGTLSAEEASVAARLIEDDAFAAAGGSAATEEDGIQILQVYSKEISKRMLDTVKTKIAANRASASAAENGAPEETAGTQSPAETSNPPDDSVNPTLSVEDKTEST